MKLVEGRKQYVEEQNNQCYKNRKQCRKEKKKLALFTDCVVVYVENSKVSTKQMKKQTPFKTKKMSFAS